MEDFDFVHEVKVLALKARMDEDFCGVVMKPSNFFEMRCKFRLLDKTRNYINEIKIFGDFVRFLERLLEVWDGRLDDLPIDGAISIIIESIESNTFWWLADENNSRDPYKVTIALFESINYLCWHDSYWISIGESTLQSILKYPIAIDWNKYN